MKTENSKFKSEFLLSVISPSLKLGNWSVSTYYLRGFPPDNQFG